MFIDEYDYDTDIAVQREEAMEEGIEQGAQQQAIQDAVELLKENIPPEKIAKCIKLPIEKVLELQQTVNKLRK